jgi:creatinine amidohydrolase
MEKEIHADVRETSFIQYRYPELLRESYKSLPPIHVNIEENFRKGVKTFKRMGAEKGYIGTPAQASAEYGKQHLEGGADIIANSALKLYHGERLPEIGKDMLLTMKFFVRLD